jgi:hypothetical protein
MPRRLNYTGRKKINRSDIVIRVIEVQDTIHFDASFTLASYDLDPEAHVYVEAYRGASAVWKRFDFGRVGLLRAPAERSLNEFGSADGIRFRVKVCGSGVRVGKLLAEADAVHPRLPSDDEQPGRPLIDTAPDDLRSEIWRLSFDDTRPVLLINERIPGWSELVREPLFRALSAPAIMRQVLTKILVIDADEGDEDDEDDWRSAWLTFSSRLAGVGPRPTKTQDATADLEELERWIDDAVNAFSAKSNLFENFIVHREVKGAAI